jgi:HSP20 family protein
MTLVRYSYPTFRSLAPLGFQRSPWGGLESEIDRLFATALTDFGGNVATRFPVDLYTDEANTYVRAELPGVNRDAINVEMTDGTLTIAVAQRTDAKATEATDPAKVKEEELFSFTRSVSIPEPVQTDKVSAAYENGVLTVTLPKQEAVKPKKVTVAVK